MIRTLGILLAAAAVGSAFEPAEWADFRSSRADGRFVSSRGAVQGLLEDIHPACAFDPAMPAADFPAWQARLREAMRGLMKFPTERPQALPRRVATARRAGYRVEKWEAYPLPHTAVPFLVLIPDTASGPLPAVLCLPGSGQPKEYLAGETSADLSLPPAEAPGENAMALHYVREGWVAVVVDNAGTGETGDAEQAAGRRGYDDDNLARFLLEMGWSWLGYTAYADQCILDWMREQPYINRERIILSGFSLGTEPLMVLGVLNPDIFAFVYNDFLCRTLERARVMTRPARNGSRPAPNSIRHLIPGFWLQFDFPDIVAALAPRPVICTEGGADRDFRMVAQAFQLAGAPQNFSYHHQPRFAHAKRWQGDNLPTGLDRDAFFRMVNVDPRHHFFKKDLVLPWLRALLVPAQQEAQP
ncbi:MAG: hypothetical protein J1E42_03915 [Akkermansiaceae bacterium]|nr:hypothetical protein [Akkermansiaceae bacterium]